MFYLKLTKPKHDTMLTVILMIYLNVYQCRIIIDVIKITSTVSLNYFNYKPINELMNYYED